MSGPIYLANASSATISIDRVDADFKTLTRHIDPRLAWTAPDLLAALDAAAGALAAVLEDDYIVAGMTDGDRARSALETVTAAARKARGLS